MNEQTGRPNLPGYVSVKEAAEILGISDKRVYEYVDEGRLPSLWAADVIMIPLDAVKQFRRQTSGRPRKSIPMWRLSSGENTQFMTLIEVPVHAGRQDALARKLEEIWRERQHLFPGTIARYIAHNEHAPEYVEIVLIWKSAVMPDETTREQALEKFRQALADVLDWNRAQYSNNTILMHT